MLSAGGFRRGPMGLAVFAALLVHVVPAVWMGAVHLARIGQRGDAPAGARPALETRRLLVQAVSPPAAEPEAVHEKPPPSMTTVRAARPADEAGPAQAAAAPTPAASGPAVAGPSFDEQDYLPRAALSTGPGVIGEVPLAWPASEPLGQRQVAQFRLFIDDLGQVRRLQLVGGWLAPPFQNATWQAFHASAFSPGLIEGRAVRSWILIEVEFDGRGDARARWLP